MIVRAFILSLLSFISISFAETPSDSSFKDLIGYLKSRTYIGKWEFYPLTRFPILIAQHYPWTMGCDGNYRSVNDTGGIACLQKSGICYVGSRFFVLPDSVYLYRAEKYEYKNKDWKFLEDYVVVTDAFGTITDVLTRNTINGHFTKVELDASHR